MENIEYAVIQMSEKVDSRLKKTIKKKAIDLIESIKAYRRFWQSDNHKGVINE